MNDEQPTLIDDLLALFTDWESIEQSYRDHLAGLLDRCRTDLSSTTGVHRSLVYDVTTHALALEQLRACMAGLESVLASAEDRRQEIR